MIEVYEVDTLKSSYELKKKYLGTIANKNTEN